MTLYELIENCHLDIAEIDRFVMSSLIRQHYTDQDIEKLIGIFLSGLVKNHSLPGNLIYALADMSDCIRNNIAMTPKQFSYIINNIVDNWREMSAESRAELYL